MELVVELIEDLVMELLVEIFSVVEMVVAVVGVAVVVVLVVVVWVSVKEVRVVIVVLVLAGRDSGRVVLVLVVVVAAFVLVGLAVLVDGQSGVPPPMPQKRQICPKPPALQPAPAKIKQVGSAKHMLETPPPQEFDGSGPHAIERPVRPAGAMRNRRRKNAARWPTESWRTGSALDATITRNDRANASV